MQMGSMQNGLKRKRRTTKRRRNATPKTAAKRNPSPVTLSRASAFAKRNGLKLVSKSAANPKRKRSKRRNGLTKVPRTRNGLLGSGKADAEKVVALGGGMVLTAMIGRFANGFLAPYAARFGAGRYSQAACEFAAALLIMPWLGTKVRNKAAGDFARLGGIATGGFTLANVFAPGFIPNPFGGGEGVIVGGLVTPQAAAAIAQGVANSPDPQAAAAKVGNAMNALSSGQAVTRPSYAGVRPRIGARRSGLVV